MSKSSMQDSNTAPDPSTEARSDLESVWASMAAQASCQPNDPPEGAVKEPIIGEGEVPDTGGQHVKGEEFACGEWRSQKHAPCGTVSVTVPKGVVIVAVRRFAKENFNNIWHPDPAATMGWCDWVGMSRDALPDGRVVVSTTLKNWSHDRPRRFRLEVWVR